VLTRLGHRAILAVGPSWLRQAVDRIGPTTVQVFVFLFYSIFFSELNLRKFIQGSNNPKK
jgi:hypothetical protein